MYKLKFYIPFLYTYQTRLNNNLKGLLNWFCIYVIPTFFLFIIESEFNFNNVTTYIIGTVLIYLLYEIGYIQNDTETIKNEFNPTIRLSRSSLDYYYKFSTYIYTTRVLSGLLVSYVIMDRTIFLILSWSIIPIYLIYNNIRIWFNLIIHLILLTIRYSGVVFLSSNTISLDLLILSILIFTLPTFIELLSKGKFNTRPIFIPYFLAKFSDRYKFRFKYYVLLFGISYLLSLLGYIPINYIYIILHFILIRGIQLKLKK